MAAKLKRLINRNSSKGEDDDTELLLPPAFNVGLEENETHAMVKDCTKTLLLFDLSATKSATVEQEKVCDRYEQITCTLSKGIRNFIPSPEMMRRNAICEEIEKRTVGDKTGDTLKKCRVEMLKVSILKEMNII